MACLESSNSVHLMRIEFELGSLNVHPIALPLIIDTFSWVTRCPIKHMIESRHFGTNLISTNATDEKEWMHRRADPACLDRTELKRHSRDSTELCSPDSTRARAHLLHISPTGLVLGSCHPHGNFVSAFILEHTTQRSYANFICIIIIIRKPDELLVRNKHRCVRVQLTAQVRQLGPIRLCHMRPGDFFLAKMSPLANSWSEDFVITVRWSVASSRVSSCTLTTPWKQQASEVTAVQRPSLPTVHRICVLLISFRSSPAPVFPS